jgi:hypothetical protein
LSEILDNNKNGGKNTKMTDFSAQKKNEEKSPE